MAYVKLFVWVTLVAMSSCFAGCSSKPVYEKMSAVYMIKLDLSASNRERGLSNLPSDHMKEDNMDLADQLVNQQLQDQLSMDSPMERAMKQGIGRGGM